MKEQVVLSLHDVNPPKPEFRRYYEARNGNIASDIARYMDLPYVGEVSDVDRYLDTGYFVPSKTLTNSSSLRIEPQSPDDFYGARVDSADFVGKSILHPSVSSVIDTPVFHSERFSEAISSLVLPGVTGFTKEDLLFAYRDLSRDQILRLKLPGESDGNGQFQISCLDQLVKLLGVVEEGYIEEHGIVLESNLVNPATISVGFATLGKDTFSFIAYQKNELVSEDNAASQTQVARNRYGGAGVITIRGGLEKLFDVEGLDPDSQDAVRKCFAFNDAYLQEFNLLASRLSYDYLAGFDSNGKRIGGVTDITARIGGTCPALLLSAEHFKNNSSIQLIKSEVTLNYSPGDNLESESGAKRYIDFPSLRLTARVNSAIESLSL